MSKKKGLSAEEKKVKVHEIFLERKDVFNLKEIEKIASKEKGINSMLVKEIVQSLVDDSMVDTEKVGISNYYWSFPSKVAAAKALRLDDLKAKVNATKQRLSTVDKELKEYEASDQDAAAKASAMTKLDKLKVQNDNLKKELEKYKDCDPKVLATQKKELVIAKDATNRWTDNVFALKTWCKEKANVEDNVFHKQFEIPEDMDFLQ